MRYPLRPAITKDLRVLEDAGLVHGEIVGREDLFKIEPEPLDEAKEYLDRVAQQWDAALVRLKTFAEKNP